MISQKLQEFEEEIKPIGEIMTIATIEMYRSVVSRFLPTPTKIHYLFNLRDISRVIIVVILNAKEWCHFFYIISVILKIRFCLSLKSPCCFGFNLD